ncbi:hypothetical protein CLIB1444_05S08394 [[Candida] jaroonii]|uniref:Uncharacterized protein n=1 Tax=[Candida] jaroonii TaxID=467808 RepID=A0ACA9Y9I7_9ASCO|nr:hypothetical protein CLIB1444_05S08394 [[Candida] jaroonii]
MSDNLAGLTLLALGNCSPDILTTYKAMSIGEPNLALSELIGSCFLITTVVIGMIAIIHPFKLPRKIFLRDSGFLWMILFIIFVSLCNGYISISASIILIICYTIYVVYIVVSHHILRQKVIKNLRDERIRNSYASPGDSNNIANDSQTDIEANLDLIDLPTIDEINLNSINEYDEDFQRELVNEYDEFRRFNHNEININSHSYGLKQLIKELTHHNNHGIQLTHERPLFSNNPIELLNNEEADQPFETFDNEFLNTHWKILELDSFKSLTWYEKVGFVLTHPFFMMIKFTTPNDGPFEFFQLIISFIYLNFLISWKLWVISIPLSVGLVALIRKYQHQLILSFLGFIISITWIAFFANEIINNINSISVIFQLSEEILGFTIFAIGNSVGDIIANFTVAKMGMPIMAFAACFGSPILSLTSLGFNTLMILLRTENYSKDYINHFGYLVNSNVSLIVLSSGGLINLIVLIFLVYMNDYLINERIGYVLLFNWGLVTGICVLLELVKN